MSTENSNSHAFPRAIESGHDRDLGLTKREYAAIKIMADIASSALPKTVGQVQYMAESAVVLADALFTQLSK